jgi:HD-GYP domain-containing protein (c-di-GMP phosphodiesterase class II)
VINVSTDTASTPDKLQGIHDSLKDDYPGINRISVAVYEQRTDRLQTFVHSTDGPVPFVHYDARLNDVPSLVRLADHHVARVIDDFDQEIPVGPHTRALAAAGYRSSYAMPFYDNGSLFGFLFYDSREPHYFSAATVRHLSIYSHLIALLVLNALAPARVLRSALDVAREFSHYRDRETGVHLDRMARYARLIAQTLGKLNGLDDEFVEFVFLFAPLHDVGKIAVPDTILLKPGRLSPAEFEQMKAHVASGVELVEKITQSFGLGRTQRVEILRNIVRFHHEWFDGSGYLEGRSGEHIPIEARIVSVADVFDALTSARPYKLAWSNEESFALLNRHAGRQFDARCVDALTANLGEIEAIQQRFRAAGALPQA